MRWILPALLLPLLACQSPLVEPSAFQSQSRSSVHTPQGGTLNGMFRLHTDLVSSHLRSKRDVLVYLPPGYEQGTRNYPVLYMHDGNNLFDQRTAFGGTEWQVDERAGELMRKGIINPVIIVGIYNSADRLHEYTWYPMIREGQTQGGQGAAYARFLVEELKPLIDKTYRTRPEREYTAVMGSSLGGLISFYLGLHYPDTFSQIGLISPSIWWKDRAILKDVSRLDRRLKVWLDMGTREGQEPSVNLQDAKALAQALEKNGFEHFKNLAFHIAPDATHSESSWSARLEHPLRFFFGTQKRG